ncbi:tyrosine-type recombinase/integrase [Bacillus licheniformis]|uniref:tyrosine-type recombinase/integrase n=1 Tax=Bacillus licheniformis TaxID=1402 RepID=UPI000B8B2D3F|nr:tyrosine-type recombinase/integrase [Bacillus licheniformis]MCA1183431.1 tyrosine-type recombinase/integrase [Bacillus licheniformis]RCK12286.1 site-specific integrase [Bacillus licheniformis]TWK97967.1 Tyrosine recombinase XerC [Bacillus licheniformis]WCO61708.1 tyrosine-type recombinase/integrase [Bacillus licheniformis]
MYTKELIKGKKWLAMADGPKHPVTGKRRQISRRGRTKKEAEQKVLDAIAAMKKYKIDESVVKKMTFEQLAAEWFNYYALTSGNKKGTLRIRKTEIQLLNKFIAKIYIVDITLRDYQEILNDLVAQGYARNTISGAHTTAGMIFKYAVKMNYLKENPISGAVVPKKRLTIEDIENNKIEEKYFEKHELEEFLLATKEFGLDLDFERFYLLAFSGMRSGELCALKWSDINFETNEIRITKTIYSEKNNMRDYELIPPKTAGSIRTIEMEDQIIDMLKDHQRRQKKRKLKSRIDPEEYHNENFVFARENGYPFVPFNLIPRMHRILKKTSIKKHATPHIFRHTHISMLTEAGVDLPTIMERVGHDDMKTTTQIYTHVTKKMKKDASQKVQQTFGNILNIGSL